MAVSDEVAPDEWECRVFLAVAEHRQHTKAAEALSPSRPRHLRDRPYARQLVGKTIQRIERWCGEPLFEGSRGQLRLTERGREFERAARSVVGEYQLMRRVAREEGLPRLACLPHHAAFVAPAQARLRERFGRPRIAVQYLHDDAGLRGPALLVGAARPAPDARAIPLYTARLEAMVPAGRFPAEGLALPELLQRYHPLLHLTGVPADRIDAWGLRGPAAAPAGGSADIATTVVHLRHEAGAAWDGRILVAPSDVALAFKPGMEFGGRHADRFTWVPLVLDGPLTHEVRLTVRRGAEDDEAVPAAIVALQSAVRALPALAGGNP
ncbi:hypothetical protein [Dactylosporangium sp. CA-092794]|uniref:hypothetical protein n=1 Tax=Dactylosporangium sp. CA-092794 TaxID=3239929 RepID=UPI003D91500D